MAEIRLHRLRKAFGDFVAVQGSGFTIDDGSFFVMLGPSGCGKTTTLRMIAGLELPSEGQVFLDGIDVSAQRASQRDIAFVFQLFAFYPHMNVRQNIGFPLSCQGVSRREIHRAVAETARLLRIDHLLEVPVSRLAGGDRQRVALGRAIVRRPKAFLMDEPLGTLDTEFRALMCQELRGLHERLRATTVYVTHDQTRSDVDGRYDRGDEPWRGRADRPAAGDLRPAGEPVCRRVPGQPADELPGAGGRAAAGAGQPAARRRRGGDPAAARGAGGGRADARGAAGTCAFRRCLGAARRGAGVRISRHHPDRSRWRRRMGGCGRGWPRAQWRARARRSAWPSARLGWRCSTPPAGGRFRSTWPRMAEVALHGVGKRFGRVAAVSALDLTIADGELVALLGPTGAGKTTTLRLVAGLERPDAGRILIGGRDVTRVAPAGRDVAFVFQQYALYPQLTVFDNLAFPLRAPSRRVAEAALRRRVEEVAALLHLSGKLASKATLLSGGEMQRVAIGRALVRSPAIYLMDEPLSSLDAQLRADLRIELKRIQQELGATILYVTHDQIEAMTMAGRIGVMGEGRLVQLGTPQQIYEHPETLYVATRLGSPAINLLPAGALPVPGAPPAARTIGLRTEHLHIRPAAADGIGRVLRVEHLGDQSHLHVEAGGERLVTLVDAHTDMAAGDRVALDFIRPLFFDADGRRIAAGAA